MSDINGVTSQLKEYKEMLDSGILSQEEFDQLKKKLLDGEMQLAEGKTGAINVETVKDKAQNLKTDNFNTEKAGEISKELTGKVKEMNSSSGGKLKLIVSGVVVLLLVIFAFNWFGNSDYRNAMKTADTYFKDGKFGDAEEAYKKATELKPGDKKANERYDASKTLSYYWMQINDDDYDYDGQYVTSDLRDDYNALLQKIETTKDSEVKQEYQDAADRIKQDAGY